MKICYIGWGHSIHMQRWVKWFAERGHEVHLITDRPEPLEKVIIHDISRKGKQSFNFFGQSYKIYVISSYFKIKKILKTIRPDILHLQTLNFPAYLGLWVGYRPLVVTFWNGDLIWKYQWSKIRNLMLKKALYSSDLITVNSQDQIRKALDLGTNRSRIYQIFLGVDITKFYPNKDNKRLREELKLDNSPVILSIRNLGEMYNIDVVLKAFKIALSKIPELKLILKWFFGQENLDKYRSMARQLNIEDAVRFVGKVDYGDMPQYYNIAEATVGIPDKDSTACSLLESMACGSCPIVSNLEAPREWIKDGWNGYLVKPNDCDAVAKAIIRAIENKTSTELFKERNLKIVKEKADFNKNMEEAEKLCIKLVEERKY